MGYKLVPLKGLDKPMDKHYKKIHQKELINLMVYCHQKPPEMAFTYIRAQIDNSIALNWPIKSIKVVTNFCYTYRGVNTIVADLTYSKGNKAEGIYKVLKDMNCDIWFHDLDAWQQNEFKFPQFADLGVVMYRNSNRINSGSLFCRQSALDIIHNWTIGMNYLRSINKFDENDDETVLTNLINNRFTTLPDTYNFCKDDAINCQKRTQQPNVVHFHAEKSDVFQIFKNKQFVSDRLLKILQNTFDNCKGELRYRPW